MTLRLFLGILGLALPVVIGFGFAGGLIAYVRWKRKQSGDTSERKAFRAERLQYDMTEGMEQCEDGLVVLGNRIRLGQMFCVTGARDPQATKESLRRGGGSGAELLVGDDTVVLTEKGRRQRFPRESLTHVMCCSPRGSKGGRGYGLGTLCVCLHFDDKHLGNVVVAAFGFSVSLFDVFGQQPEAAAETPHHETYGYTCEQAESTARGLAEQLGVPYHENYAPAIVSAIAGLLN